MIIDIISVLPELLESPLQHSIMKRAQEKGHLTVRVHALRQWAVNEYGQIDDYQYGGGAGMVLRPDVVVKLPGGKSIVIEPVDGTLKVHDAPLGVMTNAPTYDWHMTNLRNYVNFSMVNRPPVKVGSVTLVRRACCSSSTVSSSAPWK